MTDHRIGTRQEWQAARDELLRLEKEHTRMGDDLARMRRELPWVRVEKEYRFDTSDGGRTLPELFDGRSQLLIYHFMFGPSYAAGCPTCSSSADAVNAVLPHLHARDVTMLYVSRAPIERLLAYEERMGWSFPWVSCGNNDFNFDLGFSYTDEQVNEFVGPLLEGDPPPILDANATASGTDVAGYLTEGPGFSVYAKDDGVVYHTYSTQARGLEFLMGLFDVAGNVWEWTADYFTPRHPDEVEHPCCTPHNPRVTEPDPSVEAAHPTERFPRKVIKGGSHLCAPNYCLRYRPAARSAETIETSTGHIGFRCVVRSARA